MNREKLNTWSRVTLVALAGAVVMGILFVHDGAVSAQSTADRVTIAISTVEVAYWTPDLMAAARPVKRAVSGQATPGPAAADAASAYAVVDLGTLAEHTSEVIRALSQSGEVVGGARPAGLTPRAFILSNTRFEWIEGLPGTDYSAAHGINDLSEIVGSSNTATSIRCIE